MAFFCFVSTLIFAAMQPIKNIIFDLGGVFMNIDYSKTRDAFVHAGVLNFDELYSQHHVTPAFHDLETGKISDKEFYTAFKKAANIQLTDDTIKNAWNAMLLNFPAERLTWLKSIGTKYKIFLFSNTNQIHYDCFMDIFEQAFGERNLNNYFIKAYYSQNMGLRKPDSEAFQFILNEQHLNATETLFIDDTLKNIEGAKVVGLQTILLTAPQTVLDLNL